MSKSQRQTNDRAGFGLVELTISTFVVAISMLVTMLVVNQMSGQASDQRGKGSADDNARILIEEITRLLRGAGSQADMSRGQGRFVFAGPYTVGINANLSPIVDPDGTAAPQALDPGSANSDVPLSGGLDYVPPRKFETGAETIVITVDSNRDGYVTMDDAADDEAEDTDNPRDFVLKAFSYGNDGVKNTVDEIQIGLLRGPVAFANGGLPSPLFQFWIDDDNDSSTDPVLHGDADADGELSPSELSSITPVPGSQLALIEKVDVTALTEPANAVSEPKGHSTVLKSAVTFRNRNSTSARVIGTVFHDYNSNGIQDTGEVPMADVIIRCSNGYSTKTNIEGRYSFVLTPGTYTVQEIDPTGYSSTTDNNVAITPAPGSYSEINFGDISTSGSGIIFGLVYNDANQDSVRQVDEQGIAGVNVFLNTGTSTVTDFDGKFYFAVQTDNYTVTEVDSAGWASTTPNVVDVDIISDGDSAFVSYGDYFIESSGTIQGLVYLDEDNDGVHDNLEGGIANVTITIDDNEATVTDAAGEFSFTVEPGIHKVTETDPPAHTSSTVNTYYVSVTEGETSYVSFGDIGQEDISFQEITLGETERALSIQAVDFGEDSRSDLDLILGTHYVGGSNDILVWWNDRKNSSTPNSSIFPYSPDLQRTIAADVNSIDYADLDGNGTSDIVAVHGTTSNNITVWLTQSSGNSKGELPNTPDAYYSASSAIQVQKTRFGALDTDGNQDFVVGTKTGLGQGRLEIWHGAGDSDFVQSSGDVYSTTPDGSRSLGEVTAIDVGDFNRDGVDDIVFASKYSDSYSEVMLFLYSIEDADHKLGSSFDVPGQVNDLVVVDMMEDDLGDLDIVVGVQITETSGVVQVWHNRGNNQFGFGPTPNATPSDYVDPGGAVLSVVAVMADNDVFPDIIAGTRTSTAYDGQVTVYRAFGFLPSSGTVISNAYVGEVVTMTSGDFNKDGAPDLAAGTRTSGSTGKVVIYFNELSGI